MDTLETNLNRFIEFINRDRDYLTTNNTCNISGFSRYLFQRGKRKSDANPNRNPRFMERESY